MAKFSVKKLGKLSGAIGLASLAVGLGYYFMTSLKPAASEIPEIDLYLERITSSRGEYKEAMKLPKLKPPANCPVIKGGDHQPWAKRRPKLEGACRLNGLWRVVRHPIAYSLYINQGSEFLEFWDENPEWQSLRQSPVVKGLLKDWTKTLSLQLEGIQGLELGMPFLATLVRAGLLKGARLDFDVAHGREGLVLSFTQNLGGAFAKAFDSGLRMFSKRRYKIVGSNGEIYHLKIGLETLYVGRMDHRYYVGLGLTGLLNVLDTTFQPPTPTKDTVTLVVRPQAYFDRLLSFVSPNPEKLNVTLGFVANGKEFRPGQGLVPESPVFAALAPEMPAPLIAATPHDAAFVFLSSLAVKPFISSEKLLKEAKNGQLPLDTARGKSQAGIGLIWDMNGSHPDHLTEVGLMIGAESEALVKTWHRFLEEAVASRGRQALALCGPVLLLATSPSLLTRMEEACQGTNESLAGHAFKPRSRDQVYFFGNVSVIGHELFVGGGGLKPVKSTSDQGEDFQKAKDQMSQQATEFFKTLPVLGFKGQYKGQGGITLAGFKEQVQGL